PLLGGVDRVEHGVLEHERPDDRVAQLLTAFAAACDLVSLPRLAELGAGLSQRLDQLLERRVPEVPCAVSAELRGSEASAALPIGEQLATGGVHERYPQMVPRTAGDAVDVAEHRTRRAIPCQIVPALSDHDCGARHEVLDESPQRRRNALGGTLARRSLLAA